VSSPDKLSLHNLYNFQCPDCGGHIERLAISETENDALQKAFNKVARWIYKNRKRTIDADDLNENAVQPLLGGINAVLQDGFNRGIEHSVPDRMKQNLSENVYLFSGAKTYAELKELSEMLLDDTGNIKPFSKFWQDVESIHPKYNRSYLQAEYIFATQSAQMASKWSDYEADGDRYNLQYRTAADDRVRDSHRVLHNTTLPPSDPFWKDYFPPNGWRCRCTTVQVRKSKYPESDSYEAQNLGAQSTEGRNNIFRFNPGKEQVIFPKHHPYLKSITAEEKSKIMESITEGIFIPVKAFKNGGKYFEHELIDKKKSDYKLVKNIGIEFARLGKKVKATPLVHFKSDEYQSIYKRLIGTKYERKCPDLLINGNFYEVESYTPPFKRDKISGMFTKGLKQSSNIIINNTKGASDRHIKKIIHDRIRIGQSIDEVWLYEKGNIRLFYKKQ